MTVHSIILLYFIICVYISVTEWSKTLSSRSRPSRSRPASRPPLLTIWEGISLLASGTQSTDGQSHMRRVCKVTPLKTKCINRGSYTNVVYMSSPPYVHCRLTQCRMCAYVCVCQVLDLLKYFSIPSYATFETRNLGVVKQGSIKSAINVKNFDILFYSVCHNCCRFIIEEHKTTVTGRPFAPMFLLGTAVERVLDMWSSNLRFCGCLR